MPPLPSSISGRWPSIPTMPRRTMGWGLVRRQPGRPAIASFRRALRSDPLLSEAHLSLGREYLGRGQANQAGQHFLQALRVDPDSPEAHLNLGLAQARRGLQAEASAAFRQAAALDPASPEAHYNLGVALARQGRIQQALQAFRQAVHLNAGGRRSPLQPGDGLQPTGPAGSCRGGLPAGGAPPPRFGQGLLQPGPGPKPGGAAPGKPLKPSPEVRASPPAMPRSGSTWGWSTWVRGTGPRRWDSMRFSRDWTRNGPGRWRSACAAKKPESRLRLHFSPMAGNVGSQSTKGQEGPRRHTELLRR